MPELPEVETVMRGLRPCLEGHALRRVTTHREGMRFAFPPDLARRLTGRRVLALARRGKYILARLDGAETLLLHLGMSGRMVIAAAGSNLATPHEHLVIETDQGVRVGFVDPRRFGCVDLLPTAAEPTHRLLVGMGPEPLDDGFTAALLGAALAGTRTPIKAALLDQSVVAGLGNIYVSEALFRARISPLRSAATIPGARAARLVPAIKATLTEAIAAGGSSLRDHVQPNGELGYFQHAWRVYAREGEACAPADGSACPGPPACPGIAAIRRQTAR